MIEYQKAILTNGLTVIVEQDKSTTLAAVNILYKVGSRNEHPDRTGFAHLFEHLMFGGSRNAPDFDTPLQNASGENNAFTNNDYTNYYNIVPVENIEVPLWLEADRMAHLNISTRTLDVQRKVVVEEFNEVCLNKPYGDNWHHLSSLAYSNHSYSWPTIGKIPDHIKQANLKEVREFYDKYYHPGNAILSVSGPLPADQVFELAEKWFGNIKDKPSFNQPIRQEPLQTKERYKEVNAQVPKPMFVGGCHMPGRNHEHYYACDLLSDILANGKSSRMYSKLVKSKKIMLSVDCYLTGTFDPGLIVFEGMPSPRYSVKEAIDVLWEEVHLIHRHPPDDREIQKVKNKVISSITMNDLSVLNKAVSLAYFESLGSIDLLNKQEECYREVDTQQILDVAKAYLRPENASFVEYIPTVEA